MSILDEGIPAGAAPIRYWMVQEDQPALTDGGIIVESLVTLYVNGLELATVMCSPLDLEALALGFLFNEGVIQSLDEVGLVKANAVGSAVDVLLTRRAFDPPRRLILTSGCGGGITLEHLTETYPPLTSAFATRPSVVFERMRDLQGSARLYQQVRGVHAAVLADESRLLASAEDVGRHNAVDKIAGKALLGGIDPRNRMILTSGRISSEMLSKARRMHVPLVASRTSPTSITVRLAEAWNICVVGYVRHGSLRVYTHPQRLGLPPLPTAAAPCHPEPQRSVSRDDERDA
ncbi:MAG: formate dehydrogenase accessory sulfurtransferase FdhD [Anaerolineae bacterium]|nr:formate dehydrogenase accessory sulfurtransferase FdhD [Anaerolineae bacterium]NUQ04196.1 formate dehydrogenase accessory sulfurtransferase FdhD [Anaerolineae bacterium]